MKISKDFIFSIKQRRSFIGLKRQSIEKDDSGSDDPIDREKEKDGFDGTRGPFDKTKFQNDKERSGPNGPSLFNF